MSFCIKSESFQGYSQQGSEAIRSSVHTVSYIFTLPRSEIASRKIYVSSCVNIKKKHLDAHINWWPKQR